MKRKMEELAGSLEKKKSKAPLFECSRIRGLPSLATFTSQCRESPGIRSNEESPNQAV